MEQETESRARVDFMFRTECFVAGLGMKEKSDYNRNIYLDIMKIHARIKELESRYQALEKEAEQLNVVLSLVIVGFVLVSLFFLVFQQAFQKTGTECISTVCS